MVETFHESKQQRSETTKQVPSKPITNFQPTPSFLAQNNKERQINILDIHRSTPYQPKEKTYQSPNPYSVHSSQPTHH